MKWSENQLFFGCPSFKTSFLAREGYFLIKGVMENPNIEIELSDHYIVVINHDCEVVIAYSDKEKSVFLKNGNECSLYWFKREDSCCKEYADFLLKKYRKSEKYHQSENSKKVVA